MSTSLGVLAAAYSQAPAGGLLGGGGGGLVQLTPLLIMFLIFYFLLIRPQQKKQREHQDWLNALKKGDEVVTSGGLWGRITGLSESDQYVTLELQEKVRVRVLRSHIQGKAPAPAKPKAQGEAAK